MNKPLDTKAAFIAGYFAALKRVLLDPNTLNEEAYQLATEYSDAVWANYKKKECTGDGHGNTCFDQHCSDCFPAPKSEGRIDREQVSPAKPTLPPLIEVKEGVIYCLTSGCHRPARWWGLSKYCKQHSPK